MGTCCCRKVVVAFIQDICLGICVIIACQILGRDRDRNFFCCPCSYVYFRRVKEHYRRFLYIVFFVIICIRLLYIQLSQESSVLIAVVCNLNYRSDIAVLSPVYIDALERLLVIQITETVTEVVDHFLIVIPCIRLRSACTRSSSGIRICNGIIISCLIVFISDVNAFGLYNISSSVICR